ncbi:MAG: transcriptional repressor LexA [Ruminococcaceae bacterium]|nr:transcriptional repressor LexA [Oscillospiraceae bacterium]
MDLSKNAERILTYLAERVDNGINPSFRDICRDLGIKSTSSVHRYLSELAEKGYIQKTDGINRSIRLTNTASTRVPLVGNVAAGTPITAIESIEDYIPFSVYHGYPASELFALRVKGDSMINIGIYSGDIVVIHQTPDAQNGEVIVAMIDNEATVKTFYRENGHFRLQPENDTMDPIIVDRVDILGKVIALLRYF